jgi:hypothetical protein
VSFVFAWFFIMQAEHERVALFRKKPQLNVYGMPQSLFALFQDVRDERTFLGFAAGLNSAAHEGSHPLGQVEGRKPSRQRSSPACDIAAALAWVEDSAFGSIPGPKPESAWQSCALFLWAGSRSMKAGEPKKRTPAAKRKQAAGR